MEESGRGRVPRDGATHHCQYQVPFHRAQTSSPCEVPPGPQAVQNAPPMPPPSPLDISSQESTKIPLLLSPCSGALSEPFPQPPLCKGSFCRVPAHPLCPASCPHMPHRPFVSFPLGLLAGLTPPGAWVCTFLRALLTKSSVSTWLVPTVSQPLPLPPTIHKAKP